MLIETNSTMGGGELALTSRPWGERVKEWRTTRNIPVAALASRLKVSPATLLAWEKGERAPKDESTYVQAFRRLQKEAGEQPGLDDVMRVSVLWRDLLRHH